MDSLLYGLFLLATIWLVSAKYRTVINPIAVFGGFFAVQTLGAPIIQKGLGIAPDVSAQALLLTTTSYSAIYFAAVAIPFLFKRSSLYPPLNWACNQALPKAPGANHGVYIAIALQFIALFALLMIASGTTEWLSSPRTAYQTSRAGAGVWWSLCQATLILLLAAFLTKKPRSASKTVLAALACAVASYFLGSKGFVLGFFVLAAFYYQHAVRPLSRFAKLAGVMVFLAGILGLQLAYGTAGGLFDAIAYFDYYSNTARFLDEFDKYFEHTWGSTYVSTLWQYVPRGIYPDKPFVYGHLVIMDAFYPGAAEAGSTPAVLSWAGPYLDFGVLGVIIDGLITGMISKAAFELLRRRKDLYAVLIFWQIGLMGFTFTFYSAPFPVFWAWLIGQMLMLWLARIVWKSFAAGMRFRRAPSQLSPAPTA